MTFDPVEAFRNLRTAWRRNDSAGIVSGIEAFACPMWGVVPDTFDDGGPHDGYPGVRCLNCDAMHIFNAMHFRTCAPIPMIRGALTQIVPTTCQSPRFIATSHRPHVVRCLECGHVGEPGEEGALHWRADMAPSGSLGGELAARIAPLALALSGPHPMTRPGDHFSRPGLGHGFSLFVHALREADPGGWFADLARTLMGHAFGARCWICVEGPSFDPRVRGNHLIEGQRPAAEHPTIQLTTTGNMVGESGWILATEAGPAIIWPA